MGTGVKLSEREAGHSHS